MEIAKLPSDEKERLSALYELNILDTPSEERFDRIVRLATALFEVPIAYIAMIDANRQWFKSSCGITKSETGRNISFCSHTILQDEPLIIPDATLDYRFSDNPMVTDDPHFRFYAGCPLRTPDGHKVATLCIGDRRPRNFTAPAIKDLKDLASMVEDQIKLLNIALLQKDLRNTRSELEKTVLELAKKNKFIRDAFGRYMTDEVAEAVLQSPESLKVGGQKKNVTVLMCDVRGFTPMSERLPAEQVVTCLNRYLECMVNVISKYGGTIDSFIGDGILVVFGAPIEHPDHAERAVACAIEMQSAMSQVNLENNVLGLPDLKVGIGINTGEVIVGNIGSEKRMKYSVIGSPVNIAARVESLTLGGQVLITESTLDLVHNIVRIDGKLRVKVKGLDDCVCIHDIGAILGKWNVKLPVQQSKKQELQNNTTTKNTL